MTAGDNRANSDDWDLHWRDLGRSAVLNPAQEYRRRLIMANLGIGEGSGARVLDLGSGLGDFLNDLQATHPEVPKLGIEISTSGTEIARQRVPHATFLQSDLLNDDPPAEYHGFATHAVCSEVLEHVDDPVGFLKHARHYMAPGCRLVVTVPGGPRSAFDQHIGHRRHFSAAELHHVLADAGFSVKFTAGSGFPFFNLYRLLVILRGRKLIGDAAGAPTPLLKTTSHFFGILFRLNVSRSRYGWQTIGVAYNDQNQGPTNALHILAGGRPLQ